MQAVRLVIKALHLGADGHERFWFDAQAAEEVFGVAVVFIGAAEPVPDGGFLDAGDGADAGFVGNGQGEGERDFVARDEAHGLAGGLVFEEERVVHGHEDAEQAQGDGHAGDGEDAAAAVAEGVFESEREVAEHWSPV
jgi:hypothetical protein